MSAATGQKLRLTRDPKMSHVARDRDGMGWVGCDWSDPAMRRLGLSWDRQQQACQSCRRPTHYRRDAVPLCSDCALATATARAVAALEIVRDLAESELVDEDENTVTCLYCGQTMLRGLQVTYIAHRPDCVYLRARRLVGEAGG